MLGFIVLSPLENITTPVLGVLPYQGKEERKTHALILSIKWDNHLIHLFSSLAHCPPGREKEVGEGFATNKVRVLPAKCKQWMQTIARFTSSVTWKSEQNNKNEN